MQNTGQAYKPIRKATKIGFEGKGQGIEAFCSFFILGFVYFHFGGFI